MGKKRNGPTTPHPRDVRLRFAHLTYGTGGQLPARRNLRQVRLQTDLKPCLVGNNAGRFLN